MENLKELFDSYKIKILEKLPYADVEHVGGSSFPDMPTKGDLDIQIRVDSKDFNRAIADCESMFIWRHKKIWTDEFTLFADPNAKLKVDIMLTVKDSAYDSFYKIRDAMIRNPEIRQRYLDLKKEYPDFLTEEYRQAKHLFFRQLEAELGLKVRPLENYPKRD